LDDGRAAVARTAPRLFDVPDQLTETQRYAVTITVKGSLRYSPSLVGSCGFEGIHQSPEVLENADQDFGSGVINPMMTNE